MKKNVLIALAALFTLFVVHTAYQNYKETKEANQIMSTLLDSMQNNTKDNSTEKETHTELTAYAVREIVTPCAKLVTSDYKYTTTGIITDFNTIAGLKVPFTTDKIVFTYSGIIQAGIDIHDVQYDVNNDTKTIYIMLPQAEKISHEIDMDSFQFETVKDSWFNAIEYDEFTNEANANKHNMEIEAEEQGTLYSEAEANAKNVIREILTQASVTQGYHYKFITAA